MVFRFNAFRDAHQMTTVANTSSGKLSQEQYDKCIGIEKLFVARVISQHKQIHSNRILSMQSSCTIEELGCVSRESSRKSQKMAWKLAMKVAVSKGRGCVDELEAFNQEQE